MVFFTGETFLISTGKGCDAVIQNMFDVSIFSVDKLVHKFYQNLGLRIESPVCKNSKKITFITYVDRISRTRQLLLRTMDKIKDISMSQYLDFSNERSIQCFVEKHATMFNEFASSNNTRILMSHFKTVNTMIVQKVRARRKNIENMKKIECKLLNNNAPCNRRSKTNLSHKLDESKKNLTSPATYKEKHINLHNYKNSRSKKSIVSENSKSQYYKVTALNDHVDNNLSKIKNNRKVSRRHNLPISIIRIARKEIETAEKVLSLYTRDINFLKRNVHVTLHVAKNQRHSSETRDQLKYNQILCRHAILCLIEPSRKAVVLFEDDLSVVIQKYLSQGYTYHFEFQRDSKYCHTALLVLSQWAKVLVQHKNTTMMRTICGILGCDVTNILILYSSEEKLL